MVVLDDDGESNPYRTMSLNTLADKKKVWRKSLNINRQTNQTDDIVGAQPFYRYTQLRNKPSFSHNGDIEGTRSTALHKSLRNKVDRQLLTNDIDGAQPHPKTFQTNRCINPLVPQYQLPTFENHPAHETKFIRDSYQIQDIEKSNPPPLYKFKQRENFECKDIIGTTPGWKPLCKVIRKNNPPHDIMLTEDVVNDQWKTQRVQDPLDPVYVINGAVVKDDPQGSKPKKLPKKKNTPFYSLISNDIEGAYPGWTPPMELRPLLEDRRHFRNTNFVGDITGAAADTVVHSIQTNRVVNPLLPTYISLDGEKLKPSTTPLYKDPAAIEAELQLDAQIAKAKAEPSYAQQVSIKEKDNLIKQLEQQLEALQRGTSSSELAVPSSTPSGPKSRPETEFVPPKSEAHSSLPSSKSITPSTINDRKPSSRTSLNKISALSINTKQAKIEKEAVKTTNADIEAVKALAF